MAPWSVLPAITAPSCASAREHPVTVKARCPICLAAPITAAAHRWLDAALAMAGGYPRDRATRGKATTPPVEPHAAVESCGPSHDTRGTPDNLTGTSITATVRAYSRTLREYSRIPRRYAHILVACVNIRVRKCDEPSPIVYDDSVGRVGHP
jgi:hypothetical protein